MLKCENKNNGLKAISAFFKLNRIPRQKRKQYDYVFEHGQLWIKHIETNKSWSVCDGEEPGTLNGFCFEELF